MLPQIVQNSKKIKTIKKKKDKSLPKRTIPENHRKNPNL